MNSKNIDLGLLILRISFAILTLFHGVYHISTGLVAVKSMLVAYHLPEFLSYGVIVGEVIAPLLILLGYYARVASAIAVFNFMLTIPLGHMAEIFQLTPYGGWAIELNILYLTLPLVILFTGAGKYALNDK